MQNSIQNLCKFIFEKPGILSGNLKILTSLPTTIGSIFFWNFAHVSYLLMSTKACSGFFLFCLNLELLDLVSTHLFFTFLLITQDQNKVKKFQTPFCWHY